MKQIHQNTIILVSYFTILIQFTDGQCLNNNKCILLKSCETYAEANLTAKLIKELRTLLCGFQKEEPKICCPGKSLNRTNDAQNESIEFLPTQFCYNQIDYPNRNYTDLLEHPWTVLLHLQEPDQNSTFYCGAALISSRYVLTAAHCVQNWTNKLNSKLVVRLGEWDISREHDCSSIYDYDCNLPVQDILVEEIISHENYDGIQSDVALLRLSMNAEFSESVKPICLLQEELPERFFEHNEVEVAGWGKALNVSGTNLKFKGYITVVDNKECKDLLTKVDRNITESHFCVKGNFCAADSGSGMMIATMASRRSYTSILYGIESYRSSNCEDGTAVYTRVDAYKDWILKQLRL